jgi:hypothetical protein
MPFISASLLAALLASSASFTPATGAAPFYDSALRLRVVRDTGTTDATCVLVHRDNRADGVVLYFATAAHLFKSPTGEALSPARAIDVVMDHGQAATLSISRCCAPSSPTRR